MQQHGRGSPALTAVAIQRVQQRHPAGVVRAGNAARSPTAQRASHLEIPADQMLARRAAQLGDTLERESRVKDADLLRSHHQPVGRAAVGGVHR